MMRPAWASRPALLAAGTFAVALALAIVAIGRWAAITRVVPDRQSPPGTDLPRVASADGPPLEVVLAAVDRDLFHPERRRPATRFRLPGERPPPVRAAPRPATLPATLQLTGTMVYPGGGGVALLREQGRSRMVRVGERVGTFTLQRVGREEAVFRAPDGRDIVVRVPRAGS